MDKLRVATVWLDGCSGCHMSLLDIDERLLLLAERIDLVYSPLVDVKVYPERVDLAIVEGAVSSEDDLARIELVRSRSALLMALGDCAVTSNVPGMRNAFTRDELLRHAYIDNATLNARIPQAQIPRLLAQSRPVHEIVAVDLFVPGCPPSADTIFAALASLLDAAPALTVPSPATAQRFG